MKSKTKANPKQTQLPIKIAYIGGGSRGWAQMVMADLALSGRLTGELVLYDIDEAAAKASATRGRALFKHKDSKASFKIRVATRVADALKGADFVFLSIQPGPLEMFANDLDIPASFGILQPVGDSTGPGGISRALRCAPIYEAYAHQIMKYCPQAWVINYTNPMTLCTAILHDAEPDIKAFGCCHEVFGAQASLSRIAKEHLQLPDFPTRREIKVDVNGVNHFTFVTHATCDGHDLFPFVRKHIAQKGFWKDRTEEVLERVEKKQYMSSCGKLVAFNFFRRFGVLGAAGDRHLAEFVPWFLRDEATLHRWGFLLTPSSYRLSHYTRPRKELGETLKGSGEEGVDQIEALLGLRELDTNVNLPNRGQIAALPEGAVVETNAQFRKDSLTPVVARPLPAGVQALVSRVVDVQGLTLTACRERDLSLAYEALLNDPLCQIDPDEALKMWRKLMKANAAMLPGYRFR